MRSMTGYGRASLERDGRELTLELKTVNHRFLDLNIRLPRALLFLEDGMRKGLNARLSRGHVDVFINYRNAREDAREVTQDAAALVAAGFLGMRSNLVSAAGESEGKIPVYRFTGGDYTVSVSRKGGYVVRALSQRAPVRSAITVDAALEKAAEFLAAHGCRGMKESYHILKDHVLTVTYCAEQNGVMCYPDMVKLAVAMDTGEMLRFDAEAYLTSHAERDLPEPAVSEEDARAMAGEGLTVQSEKLAVIPTSGAEEIYCRELICETEDGRHYLLYVNAMTGAQEKILILLEDESGTLAL